MSHKIQLSTFVKGGEYVKNITWYPGDTRLRTRIDLAFKSFEKLCEDEGILLEEIFVFIDDNEICNVFCTEDNARKVTEDEIIKYLNNL